MPPNNEVNADSNLIKALWSVLLAEGFLSSEHRSGGDYRQAWPAIVIALLRKLLGVRSPVSYSFAASEVLRRHGLRLDRASIRRFALREASCPIRGG